MTEDEAKTKWCPMVRVEMVAGIAVNRHVADVPDTLDGTYDETRCIGSGCMMWKWHQMTGPHGFCGLVDNNVGTFR